ncbi:cytochrome P450 71A1-like [Senna tora]|uniref:Cytochrome P450 71A1-like n=1 Tax=Senna tora TaxID=362788 RepID=A0A834X6C9_9FABA|nr:cytochrome P450 71A1-like [Senna tora]
MLGTMAVAFSVGNFFPSLGWIDVVTGLIPKLKATIGDLDAIFDDVIAQHKSLKRNIEDVQRKDFVDILLQIQQEGSLGFELTHDHIKAILMDMFVGGSDTSSTTMEWAMAELMKNPTKMKKVQEEVRRVVGHKSKVDGSDVKQMKYLEFVVKETLRLHPPGPLLLPRETRSSVKLRGYDIPSKISVLINAWTIQRDPQVWERAEEFIPERFENSEIDFKGQDFQFIPFGSGRKGCPGISFGVVMVEYVLANILYWFDWKLPSTAQDMDMIEGSFQSNQYRTLASTSSIIGTPNEAPGHPFLPLPNDSIFLLRLLCCAITSSKIASNSPKVAFNFGISPVTTSIHPSEGKKSATLKATI